MTRSLFRALNAPALVLLAIFGVAIQTSLFASWPINYFQPDLILLLVIWCALRRPFIEGGILTLIVSHIAEIHSAVPHGVFLMSYMLVFLLMRLASRFLVIPNLSSYAMLTLFTSIFWKLAGLEILNLLGAGANQWRHTLILLFPGAVTEGALALWVYRWLEKFDWATYKTTRAEEITEDELQLDSAEF